MGGFWSFTILTKDASVAVIHYYYLLTTSIMFMILNLILLLLFVMIVLEELYSNTPSLFAAAAILFVISPSTRVLYSLGRHIHMLSSDKFLRSEFSLHVLGVFSIFSCFGGFYLYFKELTRYQYSDVLSDIHILTFIVGVSLSFFPLHLCGILEILRPRLLKNNPQIIEALIFLSDLWYVIFY